MSIVEPVPFATTCMFCMFIAAQPSVLIPRYVALKFALKPVELVPLFDNQSRGLPFGPLRLYQSCPFWICGLLNVVE